MEKTLICKVCFHVDKINVFSSSWKISKKVYVMLAFEANKCPVNYIFFLSFSSLRDVWFSDSVHKFHHKAQTKKLLCYIDIGVIEACLMLEKYLQKNLNIKKIRFVIMAPLHGILQPTLFSTITSAPLSY